MYDGGDGSWDQTSWAGNEADIGFVPFAEPLTAEGAAHPDALETLAFAPPSDLMDFSFQINGPGEPTPNPDGTVTQLEEIEVTGQKLTMFTVFIPSTPPFVPPEHDGIDPVPPGGAADDLTPCQMETLKDRAALVAAEILNDLPDHKEWGMYLVRDADGSIRGVGPVEGRGFEVDWNTHDDMLGVLGISDWSQLVGLVHTHPEERGIGVGQDDLRDQYSPEDRDVTRAFEAKGAAADFRQYISVDGEVFQFDTDAQVNRESDDQVDGQGCG